MVDSAGGGALLQGFISFPQQRAHANLQGIFLAMLSLAARRYTIP